MISAKTTSQFVIEEQNHLKNVQAYALLKASMRTVVKP